MTTTTEDLQAKYITTKQACQILELKKLGTLYGYIKSGKLKAYKLGGNDNSRRHWRIKLQDLEEFITRHGAEPKHTESKESKVGQE